MRGAGNHQQQEPNLAHSVSPSPTTEASTSYHFSSSMLQQEHEKNRERHLRGFQEALESIPQAKKAAYLEALRVAPQVAASESDPMKFIRVCCFNYWEAAERICQYWNVRLRLFTAQRAFLPLTLKGGALQTEEVLCLNAGYPCILPKTETGQQVVLADRTRWLPTTSFEARAKCAFYIAKILAEDCSAQERSSNGGVLVLSLECSPRKLTLPVPQQADMLWEVMGTLPIRINMHYLFHLPKTVRGMGPPQAATLFPGSQTKKSFIEQLIKYVHVNSYQRHLQNQDGKHSTMTYHSGTNNEGELFQKLRELGLRESGIPTSLGGEWRMAQTINWCRQQASLEEEVVAAVSDAASSNSETSVRPKRVTSSSQRPTFFLDSSVCDSKANKRKTMNVVYSRRKREKKRQEKMEMEMECKRLKQSNEHLRKEGERLQALLVNAKALLVEEQHKFNASSQQHDLGSCLLYGQPEEPQNPFSEQSSFASFAHHDPGALGSMAAHPFPSATACGMRNHREADSSQDELLLEPRQFPPDFSHPNHQRRIDSFSVSQTKEDHFNVFNNTMEHVEAGVAKKPPATSTWGFLFGHEASRERSNQFMPVSQTNMTKPEVPAATCSSPFGQAVSGAAVATGEKPAFYDEPSMIDPVFNGDLSHSAGTICGSTNEILANPLSREMQQPFRDSYNGCPDFVQQISAQDSIVPQHNARETQSADQDMLTNPLINSEFFQLADGMLENRAEEQQQFRVLLNYAMGNRS